MYNDSKSKDVSEKLELNEKLILNSVNELCLIIKNYVKNVTKSKDYCELSSFISQINEKANSEVDLDEFLLKLTDLSCISDCNVKEEMSRRLRPAIEDKNKSFNDFLCLLGETHPRLYNVPIKIGLIGRYQTGKSALLNSLRDINDDNAAQYSPTDLGTIARLNFPYRWKENGKLNMYFVDFPGCNRLKWEMPNYKRLIESEQCDIFLIVFDHEAAFDRNLVDFIKNELKKPFKLVRTFSDVLATQISDMNKEDKNIRNNPERLVSIVKNTTVVVKGSYFISNKTWFELNYSFDEYLDLQKLKTDLYSMSVKAFRDKIKTILNDYGEEAIRHKIELVKSLQNIFPSFYHYFLPSKNCLFNTFINGFYGMVGERFGFNQLKTNTNLTKNVNFETFKWYTFNTGQNENVKESWLLFLVGLPLLPLKVIAAPFHLIYYHYKSKEFLTETSSDMHFILETFIDHLIKGETKK